MPTLSYLCLPGRLISGRLLPALLMLLALLGGCKGGVQKGDLRPPSNLPGRAAPVNPSVEESLALEAGSSHSLRYTAVVDGRVFAYSTDAAYTSQDTEGVRVEIYDPASLDSWEDNLNLGPGANFMRSFPVQAGTEYTLEIRERGNVEQVLSVHIRPALASAVEAVSGGFHHACFIVTGVVTCAGQNRETGTSLPALLGNPELTGEDGLGLMQTVQGDDGEILAGVRAISASDLHSCALLIAGGVRCWGYGSDGRLGNGATGNSAAAVEVLESAGVPLGGVSAISAGGPTCAIARGVAMCWGVGEEGTLGNNASANSSLPVAVLWDHDGDADPADLQALDGVLAIGAGERHACARARGNAMCWGRGIRLGNGSSDSSALAVQVLWDHDGDADPADLQALDGVSAIGVGGNHTCAIASTNIQGESVTGGVFCWGLGLYGRLGYGLNQEANQLLAVQVLWDHDGDADPADLQALRGASAISSGQFHSCAVATGQVFCWGRGLHGRLGNGQTSRQSVAVPASELDTTRTITDIYTQSLSNSTCARFASGLFQCWGYNEGGMLGSGHSGPSQPAPLNVYDTRAF